MAIVYTLSDRKVPPQEIPAAISPAEFTIRKPAYGPIRYVSWDPKQDYRPLYYISFDEVFVHQGTLGFFKTGLFKTIHVRALQLRRYEYDTVSDSNIPGENNSEFSIHKFRTRNDLDLISEMIGGERESIRLGHGSEIQIDRPDFSDAAEIIVDDFDYRVFFEGKQRCAIVGKRAIASYEESGVSLRGGIVVTAADGTTLRSNRIQWDPKRKIFEIDGNYLLCRDGSQTVGRSICLDEQLHKVENIHTVTYNEISEGNNYAKR